MSPEWVEGAIDTARQDMTQNTSDSQDSHTPLWTTGDVARFLRCSKRQVPRLREEGLPSIRVGSLVRFVPDQVIGWLGLRDSVPTDERARQLADVATSGDDDAAECAAADLAREFPRS